MQNPMYGMPNYSFQSPFGNGMNTSYQNQQLPHYDIVKVNGRNGAEAFQMGPNSQVLLLDETAPVLWLASTDGAGYKTVSAFDISPHQDQQQTQILGNGICNLGYEMQRNVGQLGKEVALSQANLAQQVSSAQSDLSSQMAQCCCTTQRAIDGVNYNQAINTASINANIDAKFAAMEKNQLEQTIAAQQAQISQLQLAQQMNNVVRYPNGFTYNAGMSPFCGGCCSGC